MYACKSLGAIILCLTATLAQAAGLRTIDIAADASGPALYGVVWYPCSEPPGEVYLGRISLPGVKDCPLPDKRLPLIVVSHGRTGTFARRRRLYRRGDQSCRRHKLGLEPDRRSFDLCAAAK